MSHSILVSPVLKSNFILIQFIIVFYCLNLLFVFFEAVWTIY